MDEKTSNNWMTLMNSINILFIEFNTKISDIYKMEMD